MSPRRLAASVFLAAGAAVGVLVTPARGAQQASAVRVVSSDTALIELASGLLADLATRSGLELRGPVRIERRSREQLTRYLQAKLDEELPPNEAAELVDVYALLGLVPRDFDLRSVLLGLYTEQVAGFYEPDSTALFVMDDQRPDALEGVLVHELVHAIQDQNTDLRELMDREMGNDRATAAQAAIEGHATLVMVEHQVEQMAGRPIDLGQIPDFAAQMRPLLQAARDQFPMLEGAPRVIQEALLFPYLEGTSFVQALWADGERLAPFGVNLPESTEQVLSRSTEDHPVELDLTVPSSGPRAVRQDGLGRLEMGIFLEEHGADPAVADGWEGDRYVLVQLTNGSRALGWYALWEDDDARSRFMTAMQSVLPQLGPETALDSLDVGGLPATFLRVGGIGDVTARIRSSGS